MPTPFAGKIIEIKKTPAMGGVIARGLFLSLVRPNSIQAGKEFEKAAIILNNVTPDPKRLKLFKAICGYPPGYPGLPPCFIQTLFIGLLGKYITSPVFPVNPMGLIHTVQKIIQTHPLSETDSLDLWCGLKEIRAAAKGMELDFDLQAIHDRRLVWQGLSTFLLKNRTRPDEKKIVSDIKEDFLPVEITFDVPVDTGWNYAKASGDFNPHHISRFFARLFGFKTCIAHGMWSMARSLAHIEQTFLLNYPLTIETAFKLPVFMPAQVSLGYDWAGPTDHPDRELVFELRNVENGLPHIKGRLKSSF